MCLFWTKTREDDLRISPKHISVNLAQNKSTNMFEALAFCACTAHPSLFARTNSSGSSSSDSIFPGVGFPILLYLGDITQIWWENVKMRM